MRLAWLGLYLIGLDLIVAGAWFVHAWIANGRLPLDLGRPPVLLGLGWGWTYRGIYPPAWLVAICGALVLVGLGAMLLGTQDILPRMRRARNGEPNKRVDRTA
jgi:hypothetical protein